MILLVVKELLRFHCLPITGDFHQGLLNMIIPADLPEKKLFCKSAVHVLYSLPVLRKATVFCIEGSFEINTDLDDFLAHVLFAVSFVVAGEFVQLVQEPVVKLYNNGGNFASLLVAALNDNRGKVSDVVYSDDTCMFRIVATAFLFEFPVLAEQVDVSILLLLFNELFTLSLNWHVAVLMLSAILNNPNTCLPHRVAERILINFIFDCGDILNGDLWFVNQVVEDVGSTFISQVLEVVENPIRRILNVSFRGFSLHWGFSLLRLLFESLFQFGKSLEHLFPTSFGRLVFLLGVLS